MTKHDLTSIFSPASHSLEPQSACRATHLMLCLLLSCCHRNNLTISSCSKQTRLRTKIGNTYRLRNAYQRVANRILVRSANRPSTPSVTISYAASSRIKLSQIRVGSCIRRQCEYCIPHPFRPVHSEIWLGCLNMHSLPREVIVSDP